MKYVMFTLRVLYMSPLLLIGGLLWVLLFVLMLLFASMSALGEFICDHVLERFGEWLDTATTRVYNFIWKD